MQIKTITLSILCFCSVAMADGVKHIPDAPTWEYPVVGAVSAGAVGSDYCDMKFGVGCDGVNVLITGQAAVVVFNQLPAAGSSELRKTRGIECLQDPQTKAVRCLFHVTSGSIGAGELPWISD
jgi:hypothetical protein